MLPSVVVTLSGTDINGDPFTETTTTNGSGEYLFENIPAGAFEIIMTQPNAWSGFTSTAGTLDTLLDGNGTLQTGIDPVYIGAISV